MENDVNNQLFANEELPIEIPQLIRQTGVHSSNWEDGILFSAQYQNRDNDNLLHMDTERRMNQGSNLNQDSDLLDAMNLITGITRDRNVVNIPNPVPNIVIDEIRIAIEKKINDHEYLDAWQINPFETCHFIKRCNINPLPILNILATHKEWLDISDIIYNIFADKGLEILTFLADTSFCIQNEPCRHYEQLFQLAIDCLPNIDLSDDNSNSASIYEVSIMNKLNNIISIFDMEKNPISWPRCISFTKRFAKLAERAISLSIASNKDVSFMYSIQRFRHYNPQVFDNICKINQVVIGNIYTILDLSRVMDVDHLVIKLINNYSWQDICKNINTLVYLLSLQLDNTVAIRGLCDKLSAWHHLALSAILLNAGILSKPKFKHELQLVIEKRNLYKMPVLIKEKLFELLAYSNISANDIEPLLRYIPWKASSSSSAINVSLSYDIDKVATINGAPYNTLQFDNFLVNRTMITHIDKNKEEELLNDDIYKTSFIRDCVRNKRSENIYIALSLFNHPNDFEIISGLLTMSVRYMQYDFYANVEKSLNLESTTYVVQELSSILTDMTDYSQISRIMGFIERQLQRFNEIELSLKTRSILLRDNSLLHNIPLTISLVSQRPPIPLGSNLGHKWFSELSIYQNEHRILFNRRHGNNPIRWNGTETLKFARNLLSLNKTGLWIIQNDVGLDYGGIRKEFFAMLGKEINETCCMKQGVYMLPDPNTESSLLYDIGCIFNRCYFIDKYSLNIAFHPFIHVMLCWSWILHSVDSVQTPYPWLVIEQLLGPEWLLELCPELYYHTKNLSISEKLNINPNEMVTEMTTRFAQWLPAVLIMRAGFIRHRVQLVTPPRWLDMNIAGVGSLKLDQLEAFLQVSGPEAISDSLIKYENALIKIIRRWTLQQQTELYRFWFGTDRPSWDSDEPPKLHIIGPGNKAAFSHTCFNQLEISRVDNVDINELEVQIENQLLASLENQRISQSFGMLYQIH
jgi:hypothetical protein